jgi:hypothetical protein
MTSLFIENNKIKVKGMQLALRIVKNEGINALEKEIYQWYKMIEREEKESEVAGDEQNNSSLITAKDCFQSLGLGGVQVLIRELQQGLEHYKQVNEEKK